MEDSDVIGLADSSQVEQSQVQGTQPVVKDFITDIFGADSDDENDDDDVKQPVSKAFASDDDDDGIVDSDDDDIRNKASSSNRLKKKSVTSKVAGGDRDDNDNVENVSLRNNATSKSVNKKKKRVGGLDKEILKKRRVDAARKPSDGTGSGGNTGEEEPGASGDEYDSGDEVQRTAEDDAFLAEEDDMDDIAREYDEDEQNFDDERPELYNYKKGSGKQKPAQSRESSGFGSNNTPQDPFSQTLAAMKKSKAVIMSEGEKDRIADKLLRRMYAAWTADEECFVKREPAVHKLQLLPTVQKIVAVKILQHNLLEKDILGALKDWIEPKNDADKTLPSLAVRVGVYEMLMKLPCQTDHLKRSEGDKKPIGHTILALRKHKSETLENKRLLRDLMEKWCRPVFRKVRRDKTI